MKVKELAELVILQQEQINELTEICSQLTVANIGNQEEVERLAGVIKTVFDGLLK